MTKNTGFERFDELNSYPVYFQSCVLEPLEILGVDSFTSDAVKIKARIKTLPIKQWGVGREFNRRMKKRFDQVGIEMSSSRLTVCMEGNGKAWLPPDDSQNNEGVS